MPGSRTAFKSYPLAGSRRRPSKICSRLTQALYNLLYKCRLFSAGPLTPRFPCFCRNGADPFSDSRAAPLNHRGTPLVPKGRCGGDGRGQGRVVGKPGCNGATVPKLYQNPRPQAACERAKGHFVGSAFDHLQVCFAKILRALKIARFPAATAAPIQNIPSPSSAKNLCRGTPSGISFIYIKMERLCH